MTENLPDFYQQSYEQVFDTVRYRYAADSTLYSEKEMRVLDHIQQNYKLITHDNPDPACTYPDHGVFYMNRNLAKDHGSELVPFILAHEIKHAILYENNKETLNNHGLTLASRVLHTTATMLCASIPLAIGYVTGNLKNRLQKTKEDTPLDTWRLSALNMVEKTCKTAIDILTLPTMLLSSGINRIMEKECDNYALRTYPETSVDQLRDFLYAHNTHQPLGKSSKALERLTHAMTVNLHDVIHTYPHPETRTGYLQQAQEKLRLKQTAPSIPSRS